MTWNFFYLNMYGKKYIEKAKNTLQGVPKKRICFSKCTNFGRLQIFKNDDFKLWKS